MSRLKIHSGTKTPSLCTVCKDEQAENIDFRAGNVDFRFVQAEWPDEMSPLHHAQPFLSKRRGTRIPRRRTGHRTSHLVVTGSSSGSSSGGGGGGGSSSSSTSRRRMKTFENHRTF